MKVYIAALEWNRVFNKQNNRAEQQQQHQQKYISDCECFQFIMTSTIPVIFVYFILEYYWFN